MKYKHLKYTNIKFVLILIISIKTHQTTLKTIHFTIPQVLEIADYNFTHTDKKYVFSLHYHGSTVAMATET